jgi:hypothetical protein
LVKQISTAAGTAVPAVTAPSVGADTPAQEGQNPASPIQLDEVAGSPAQRSDAETDTAQVLELRAVHFETGDGAKFWELSVWDAGREVQITPWRNIYEQWQTDSTVIGIGDGNFTVTAGGLQRTAAGAYSVAVTYFGLTVTLQKTATTF